MMDQLDLQEGLRRSEEGQARAEAGAGVEWVDRARAALRRAAETNAELTSDEVWEAGCPRTDENRALGPIMRWGVKANIIAPTGNYRPTAQPKCHACPHAVYRSLLK